MSSHHAAPVPNPTRRRLERAQYTHSDHRADEPAGQPITGTQDHENWQESGSGFALDTRLAGRVDQIDAPHRRGRGELTLDQIQAGHRLFDGGSPADGRVPRGLR
jgi:hypothetical protein